MGLSKLKLCSLNARGLRNKFKRVSLFKYLKSQKFDVICLQETHVTPNDFDCWQKQWGGQCFFNQGTARSKGEAILMSKHFTGEVALIDQSERLQIVSLKQDQLDVTKANVYAPNNTIDKPEFLNTLVEKLENFSYNTILCGDFNTTLNTDLDILSGQPHPHIEVESLNNFINIMSLTDVLRHFHPKEKEYTWCRHNPFIARRLDYCFVSEGILSSCTDCEHQFVPNTDHKAVVLNINDNDFKRGPGYYKFNNSYLREKDFFRQNEQFSTKLYTRE